MLWITLLAHVLTTGLSFVLAKRGSGRRLRLLSLIVGLMSFTQTLAFLQRTGHLNALMNNGALVDFYEGIVGLLCVWALGLLGSEILDRKIMEFKICLFEFELKKAKNPVSQINHPAVNQTAVNA
jgi:hypothetical protein